MHCISLLDGRVQLHQFISLSQSLVILSLSTSSFKILHLFTPHAVLFPLSSSINSRLRQSLQPETWTAACSLGSFSGSPCSCQQWLLSVCKLLLGLTKLGEKNNPHLR